MATVVSSTDPRSVKALALLPQARTWAHGTRRCDGRAFLIAPASKPGAVYYVDANGAECTCPDRQARRVTCKHMTVARLLLVERGAQPAATTAAAPARDDVDDLLDGVAGIKAAFGSDTGAVIQTWPATDRYSVLFPADQD